jgi:hypothetical protein
MQPDMKILKRIDYLNKKYGKEGKEVPFNIARKMAKKERNVVAKITPTGLEPERKTPITPPDVKSGVEATSTTKHQTASNSTMSAVPPKPDLTGVKHGQIGRIMNKYYEANAPAILADRETLGDRETHSRWGFSECGYKNFLKRRGMTYGGKWRSKGPEKHATAFERTPETAPEPEPEKSPSDTGGHQSTPDATKVDKGAPILIGEVLVKVQVAELPAFPIFNNNWPMLTQIEWLQTYRELARR